MKITREWFKPLCIMALVLGVLGLCCDLFGVGTSLLGTKALVGMDAAQAARVEASRTQFLPYTLPLALLQIVASGLLTAGAALCLRDARRFGALLRVALLAGLVLTPIGVGAGLFLQHAQRALILPPGSPVEAMGGAIMGLTTALVVGWAVGKMAFLYVTLRALETERTAPLPG